MMKSIFCNQVSMITDAMIYDEDGQTFPKFLKQQVCNVFTIKKEVRDEVHFLHADKYQSFLQVDFNTLGINVFYKVTLSLFMYIIKHSQSTQSDKLAIALQCLKKEVNHKAFQEKLDKERFTRVIKKISAANAFVLQNTLREF